MLALTISMLFVYILMVAYSLWRIMYCFKRLHPVCNLKRVYITLELIFVGVCSSLLLGGLLPKSEIRTLLHKFSNYYLGVFIYLLFFILCADILVLFLRLGFRKKHTQLKEQMAYYRVIFTAVLVLTGVFSTYGLIHSHVLTEKNYDITIEKDGGGIDELKVVLIADTHLGYNMGTIYLQRVVDRINELEPDIVLIAGDIYDNDYDAILEPEKCSEILRGINSKYGVYATYGNHDVNATLIGGFTVTSNKDAYRDDRLIDFCKDSGFIMLEDEAALIEDSFYLIGRTDLELTGDGSSDHKSVDELVESLDKNKPVLLMVHEPEELQECADAGVDAMFSGHTHGGQFFPLTIVQPLRWQNHWGYIQVDDMHDFVTSGLGVYGPDMRVFTNSEIMTINIKFEK